MPFDVKLFRQLYWVSSLSTFCGPQPTELWFALFTHCRYRKHTNRALSMVHSLHSDHWVETVLNQKIKSSKWEKFEDSKPCTLCRFNHSTKTSLKTNITGFWINEHSVLRKELQRNYKIASTQQAGTDDSCRNSLIKPFRMGNVWLVWRGVWWDRVKRWVAFIAWLNLGSRCNMDNSIMNNSGSAYCSHKNTRNSFLRNKRANWYCKL